MDTEILVILFAWSIEKRVKELFYEIAIAKEHDFEILAMQLMPDHVHLFLSAAPKWVSGKIVSTSKKTTPKIIFEEFPQAKKKLWGSHLWNIPRQLLEEELTVIQLPSRVDNPEDNLTLCPRPFCIHPLFLIFFVL